MRFGCCAGHFFVIGKAEGRSWRLGRAPRVSAARADPSGLTLPYSAWAYSRSRADELGARLRDLARHPGYVRRSPQALPGTCHDRSRRFHPSIVGRHALAERRRDWSSSWRAGASTTLRRSSFAIPAQFTLGGWLAGAIQWHFAAMWLWRTVSRRAAEPGHRACRAAVLPLAPRAFVADLASALRGRLTPTLGATTRCSAPPTCSWCSTRCCWCCRGWCSGSRCSSRCRQWIGGYEAARRVHFVAMAALVGFVAVHLAMVALVPQTLRTMVLGR